MNTTNATKFVRNIDRLHLGKSTSHADYGTVKLCKTAKMSKNGKRMFSVSKSKVVPNRGGYDFATLMEAFGLHR